MMKKEEEGEAQEHPVCHICLLGIHLLSLRMMAKFQSLMSHCASMLISALVSALVHLVVSALVRWSVRCCAHGLSKQEPKWWVLISTGHEIERPGCVLRSVSATRSGCCCN